jgi:hypothetical protein
MPKFRKRPVVIEAREVTVENAYEIAEWCGGQVKTYNVVPSGGAIIEIDITTPEGVMTANYCDWVIRGVKGEFYLCKPDIFTSTYEAVE